MKISYGALIPLPPDEAFGFVADPVNWPLFFPGVRSADKGDDWGRVGGHAHLTSVVLGRSLTMDLELTEWDPPRSFRYTVSQGGNPGNDDNRRTFQPLPDGTRLVGTTEIPTRAGDVDCDDINPPVDAHGRDEIIDTSGGVRVDPSRAEHDADPAGPARVDSQHPAARPLARHSDIIPLLASARLFWR